MFYFLPSLGKVNQFDEDFFQMGSNCQLVLYKKCCAWDFWGCLFFRLARLCDIFCGRNILRFYFGIQNPWRFAHASLSTRPTLRWGNLANAIWQMAWNKRNIVIIDVSTSRKCRNIVLMTSSYILFFLVCFFNLPDAILMSFAVKANIDAWMQLFLLNQGDQEGLKWIFLALGLPGTQQKGVAKKRSLEVSLYWLLWLDVHPKHHVSLNPSFPDTEIHSPKKSQSGGTGCDWQPCCVMYVKRYLSVHFDRWFHVISLKHSPSYSTP